MVSNMTQGEGGAVSNRGDGEQYGRVRESLPMPMDKGGMRG